MEKLYTSSEARKRLKASTSTFKRYVDSGKIRKVTPPGKVQGMYLKEDVDRIAEEIEQFEKIYLATEPVERLELVQAKGENDIRETVQIARQHLGDNAYGIEKRMEWFKRAKGDYVLKHDGVIVAFFSVQALKPRAINRIFNLRPGDKFYLEDDNNEREDTSYSFDKESVQLFDIEMIQSGRPLELYISNIAVRTGISRRQAKLYGMHLLNNLFGLIVKSVEQGLIIDKIWAKSSTVPGIKLSKDLGFQELGYINNEQIGFVLDPDTSDLPVFKKYREMVGRKPQSTLK